MALTIAHALLGLSPTFVATAASAQAPASSSATRSYNIPADTTLEEALTRFGREAGVMLSYPAELTAGLRSPGLQGNHSVQGGLNALLAGSKLELVARTDGSYTLRRSAEPSTRADAVLPTVVVTAAAENATGPVNGYVAQRSATGSKTDTPIIEIPQSITVVTADQMQTLKSQNLVEALSYSAGILRDEGADRTGDGFMIRGFGASATSGNLYRDGAKYQANFYNGQQELYGLERVEVLKGAASVLFGTAAPGGVVNTVSKRPSVEGVRELNVELGNFARRQVSGDFGGKLSQDGEWTGRVTGVYRDSETFVDYVDDDRIYLAPALRWQPSALTSLTLLSEYQRDQTTYVYALPAEGTIAPNVNGSIARNRFVGEPGYDHYDNTRYTVGYLFQHDFSSSLQLRHSLRYMNANNDFPSVWIAGLEADQRTTAFRGAQDREDRTQTITTDVSLQYKWGSSGLTHTSLVGVDFTKQDLESERYNRDAPPLDLYAPVYGRPLVAPNSDYLWRVKSTRAGIYAQDQMKIADKWVVLLGGRQDVGRYSEAEDPVGSPPDWIADDEKTNAFTGRVGAVYLAGNGLAPFVSFSQSFEPAKGLDRFGERFEPTRGEQYEVGARYQPAGSGTMISASLYQLTQRNVLVTDPVDPTRSIQQGEVRSRGFELEAHTRFATYGNLIAAYAYTDARTTESSPLTPEATGKRTGGVPYNQVSLWADYGFGALGLPGLRVGGGARYVSETRGTWIEGEVPAYALFDAMVSYDTGPWRFALNVTNLGDETYVASCTYGCFYGEPRKIVGTTSYRW
ncbi:MAG: TonB-dependent siderophore receptor [Moraxellaceae bacterium]|nr:TonB-dependent siderophore receptor [Moraxellaceae bacterium]